MSIADANGLALAVLLALVPAAQKKPDPKPADPAKVVEAIFAADGWTPAGQTERARLLDVLATLPPLEARDVSKWKATCAKLWAKGPKLEKKKGQHPYWEEPEERGLYIVGGDEKKPEALLIAMHGGGAGSGDAWEAQGAYQSAANDLSWLMICPQVLEKTEHGWTDSGTEEFVVQLVEAARRTWKIDANKVFLSGHSMGGFGTWTLGAHHADRVAGLAASAGAPTPTYGLSHEFEDVDLGVVPSLRNVPLVVYQSDDDPQVPPEANRVAAKCMAAAKERWGGFEFEYWGASGRGHDYPPGGMSALLAKIATRTRDPRPAKIVWQPVLTWKRQFYWLWWDAPISGAILEAEADRSKNEIRLHCDQPLSELEILLDERVLDLTKDVVILLDDKELFRGRPAASLATLVKTALTGDEELVFATSVRVRP